MMNINRIPVMNMSQIMQKIPQIKINQTITKSLVMKESLTMKKNETLYGKPYDNLSRFHFNY